jgi:poly-gamma-glutamate synthesis protein (capsule biosynthesis protein)
MKPACIAAMLAALAVPTAAHPPLAADPEIIDPSRFDPVRPLARDLETHVPDGFTVVAGGDLLLTRPLLPSIARDPGFARVVELLRGADVTFGNMELMLVDVTRFKGPAYMAATSLSLFAAQPAVAKDLAAMGFDMLSRANNHTTDWGLDGMRETAAVLDAAGLVQAGAGENLGLARRPGRLEGPKARVALVSIASTFDAHSDAQDGPDGGPARPGMNPLHVTATYSLPAGPYARLTAIRDELYPATRGQKDLALFGLQFSRGERLAIDYAMDEADVAAFLRAIRGGKQTADFLIATIHSHEPGNSAEAVPTTDSLDQPAEFVRVLARAAIDAGADMWVTHGIHHVGGVEIYKGRPILYGMGNLFWAYEIDSPQPSDSIRANAKASREAFKYPERASPHDVFSNDLYFANPLPYESFVAEARWTNNQLAELRLYPVELGYQRRKSETGVPRPTTAAHARSILERVALQSKPYGTRIELVPDATFGFVGLIR